MRQKYKDILRDKWGWVFGIILFYLVGGATLSIVGWSSPGPILSNIPGWISEIQRKLFEVKYGWFLLLVIFIVGFILGLIIKKVWRKFR